MPNSKVARRKVETLVKRRLLLHSLLFVLILEFGKDMTVLYIPESMIYNKLELEYKRVLSSHQGVAMICFTIKKKVLYSQCNAPLWGFVDACQVCQIQDVTTPKKDSA